MKINILNDKKIAILGLGVTGYDTALALKEYKSNLILITNDVNDRNSITLKKLNYDIRSEEEILNDDLFFDIILKSPGIPFNNKILIKYKKSKIINDIELAYNFIKENDLDTKIIAVTGTNGKTSTVLFIEAILKKVKFKTFSAGNISVSPLKILNENKNIDFLILELSSFQLKNINDFKPEYAFILNLSPDHLNLHKDFDDYINAKKRIYENQTKNDFLFLKKHVYDKFFKNEKIIPKVIFNNVPNDFKNEIIKLNINSLNTNNIFLVYNLCNILNIDTQKLLETLHELDEFEHRMEFVDTIRGINYYNDSKATNLNAMKDATKKLNNIILLVGGSDKFEDLGTFDDYLENVKFVIAYGQNQEKYKSKKIEFYADNLEEAFEVATKKAEKGDNILLSPAAASFDQYKNYEERGQHFKKLVERQKI